jgi:hypothetical protein
MKIPSPVKKTPEWRTPDSFSCCHLPSHIDMIIDSGTSNVLFPGKDETACTDVQLVDGILTIGDKSQAPPYYATAK